MDQDPRDINNESEPVNASADQPTTPDATQLNADGASRRNFLKAAVIATAGVAAAGGAGAGGIALISRTGGKPQTLVPVAFSVCNTKCTGLTDPCYACVTPSTPGGIQDTSVFVNNANSLLFWITDLQTEPGYYMVHVSASASPATSNGNTGGDISTSSSQSPFNLQSKHNQVYVNAFSSPSGVGACPSSGGSGGDNHAANGTGTIKQYDNISDLNADNGGSGFYLGLTPTGSPPTTDALQIALHIGYNGGTIPGGSAGSTTVTFTFSLSYSATGTAGTYTALCSSDTYTLTLTNS